jgi:hypothetical protein
VKSISPPAAAEFPLKSHIILAISQSEIAKMMWLSNDNLAQSAEKTFSTPDDSIKNYTTASP